MGLRNKSECFANTLFSIKQQKFLKEHFCTFHFLDDASNDTEKSLDIIKYFFPGCCSYHKTSKPVGFQLVARYLREFVPSDVDIVIYQSCDVIWYGDYLLSAFLETIEKNSLNIAVPLLHNVIVPIDLWKKENFQGELRQLIVDGPRCDKKRPAYLFLGAMKKELFMKATEGDDPLCDLMLKQKLERAGASFVIPNACCAVHQAHKSTIYECNSIETCSYNKKKCSRKKYLERSYPREMGYYSYKKKIYVLTPEEV